jgi:hypothetical protein
MSEWKMPAMLTPEEVEERDIAREVRVWSKRLDDSRRDQDSIEKFCASQIEAAQAKCKHRLFGADPNHQSNTCPTCGKVM